MSALRERLRRYGLSRAGLWSDVELLTVFAADALNDAERAVRRFGGRAFSNARAAQQRADERRKRDAS